jgi:dTDP-4-amino-4,6-dideoxygalactose transaminase
MDQLLELARKHNLRVIEDAAHALGASYQGRPVGALGDASVFSFYPIKPITTGQGGMLTTNDEDLAERVRLLSLHGLSKDAWNRYSEKGSWAYQVLAPGFNYVMTDIQAAIGLRQMDRLRQMQSRRAQLAAYYDKLLSGLPEVMRPPVREDIEHCWHLYAVRVDVPGMTRAQVIDELTARGIGTSVHFIPIHYHPYFEQQLGLRKGDYPVTEHVFDGLISLPIYSRMTEADVDRVANALYDIVASSKR